MVQRRKTPIHDHLHIYKKGGISFSNMESKCWASSPFGKTQDGEDETMSMEQDRGDPESYMLTVPSQTQTRAEVFGPPSES